MITEDQVLREHLSRALEQHCYRKPELRAALRLALSIGYGDPFGRHLAEIAADLRTILRKARTKGQRTINNVLWAIQDTH